jgi:hypothetical protein
LTFAVEDVTLSNGIRVIWTAGSPAATAVSADGSVVVQVAGKRQDVDGPRPSPSPLPPLSGDRWEVAAGPAELVMEWAAPAPRDDDVLLLVHARVGGRLEQRDGRLRLTISGGWPMAERRRVQDELEALAAATPRELPSLKTACSAWATPKGSAELAERLLQVTLVTGNPRQLRELSERCGRLTLGRIASVARSLLRPPRRVVLKTPP